LKTFLDSGVLVAAWRQNELADTALRVITDDARQFFTSQMVMLELLPKARFHRQSREEEFYLSHFSAAEAIEPLSAALGREAEKLAARYGLSGPDALQIAAAIRHGVKEFFTLEKPGKPMFRVKELKVISLHTPAHHG
jgi:predicted nucleic acid-binding protein